VKDQKALQRLRPISLSINHIHDVFLKLFTLGVATGPTVTSTTSFFRNENIFGVVKIRMRTGLNGINDLKISLSILWAPDQSGLTLERNGHRQLGKKRRLCGLRLECLMCNLRECLRG
jgi:hypothetical protein